MLAYQIEGAIKDLQDIINITKQDIEDIKKAKHQHQFDRLSLKDEKIKAFEVKKALIDNEISKLISNNPQIELSELLSEDDHKKLQELKELLNELKEINQIYARMVLAVSNMFNSFLESLVPTEMQGYKKVATKDPSIIEVRA